MTLVDWWAAGSQARYLALMDCRKQAINISNIDSTEQQAIDNIASNNSDNRNVTQRRG